MQLTKISTFLLSLVCALAPACVMPNMSGYGLGGGGTSPTADAQPEQLAVAGGGRALTRITSDPAHEGSPKLSPDGKSLLVSAWADEVVDGQHTGSRVDQAIIGVSPRAGNRRTVYTSAQSSAHSPAWHPSGRSFLFVSNAMGGWNLVRALSTSPSAAQRVVVREEVAPNMQGISVCGPTERVVFETQLRDRWMIAIAGLDGAEFTILGEGSDPACSPDGKTIAFKRAVGDHQQIFLIDGETGEGLVQLTSGAAHSVEPTWSPDGSHVAFASNRGWDRYPNGSADGTWNLFSVGTDGGELTQLTEGARASGVPEWGPDNRIYFSSNEADSWDIWALEVGEAAPAVAVEQ